MQIIVNSDIEASALSYYIEVQYWIPKEIGIKITFTNPLLVSMGTDPDQAKFTPKNPLMFVSRISGKPVDFKGEEVV